MNQTRYLRAELLLDGNDIAAVALGDDGFLQILLIGGGMNDLVQYLAGFGGGDTHFATDLAELSRSAV